jgi:pimeloyl-ACP methyl ester carboxylesterase
MELNFEVIGKGDPLVILHGLFGSLENWRGISKRLAEHFKIIAVDQRNHGLSPHSFEMDYRLMAGDVLHVIEKQRIPDAFVLGHSMGGKTAMQLALLHPLAVRQLVVVDIAPRGYGPRHQKAISGMLALDLTRFRNRNEIEEALAPAVPDATTRQFLLKNVTRTETAGFAWKIGLHEIAKNYAQLAENVICDKPFEKPALFIRGEKSDFLLENDLALVQRFFPRALLHTVAGTGHLVHAEKPDLFVKSLVEFLRTA